MDISLKIIFAKAYNISRCHILSESFKDVNLFNFDNFLVKQLQKLSPASLRHPVSVCLNHSAQYLWKF